MRTISVLVLVLSLALAAAARAENASVGAINAALGRWVHRTGKCGSMREVMVTMYGNGDGNVGRPVSCGGRLDTSTPTFAAKASSGIPCGGQVTFTNPLNGRSVTATRTDRGPATIATYDLGPGTYRALGLTTSRYVCASR